MLTTINKNLQFALALYAIFLWFVPLVNWITPGVPSILVPRFYLMILWAFPLLIFYKIRNIFAKVICFIWIVWFIVGSINIIASYFFYGNYYLINVEYSNFIYLTFTTVFFGGVYAFENNFSNAKACRTNAPDVKANLKADVHPIFHYFLVLFPFLWFGSLYFYAGHIPILSGTNVEEGMYDTNFGPLYGFVAFNILSMVYVLQRLQNSILLRSKLWYGFLVVCMPLFSLANGKRMALMVFLGGTLCYYVKTKGAKIFKGMFVAVGITFVVLLYCGILILRQGLNFDTYQALDAQLAIIGVEFRDFAYAVDKFNFSMLQDYHWATSTLASCVNTKILEIFGVDKQKAIEASLGYVTKPLFSGGVFGIRTGLISELYFAYAFGGLGLIFVFGVLTGWVSRKLKNSKTESELIFLSVVYGLLILVIVEQSIDVAGTLTVLFYAWIIHYFIKTILPSRSKKFKLATKVNK